jgi:hypothetical protein
MNKLTKNLIQYLNKVESSEFILQNLPNLHFKEKKLIASNLARGVHPLGSFTHPLPFPPPFKGSGYNPQ